MKNRFCKAALVLLMAVCLFLSFGLSSGNLLPLRVHAAEATITMTAKGIMAFERLRRMIEGETLPEMYVFDPVRLTIRDSVQRRS